MSCQATINSIYVSISSVAEMLKYGYICSESDVHKEVEIEFVFPSISYLYTVKSRVTKIVTNFGILLFEKNFSMVRTNMDILIINYTHVVQYNGRVWDP